MTAKQFCKGVEKCVPLSLLPCYWEGMTAIQRADIYAGIVRRECEGKSCSPTTRTPTLQVGCEVGGWHYASWRDSDNGLHRVSGATYYAALLAAYKEIT